MADRDFEPEYQEIDEDSENRNPQKKITPPSVKIERKVFHDHESHASYASSFADSQDMLDRNSSTISSRLDSHVELEGESSNDCLRQTSYVSTTDSNNRVSGTPSPRMHPLTPFLPLVSTNSHHSVAKANPTVNALATLPRRKKEMKKGPISMKELKAQFVARGLGGEEKPTGAAADLLQMGVCVHAAVHSDQQNQGRIATKPPTPPMHRMPSWVST